MGDLLAEWSSYRPSDFLMFAPATYWRLFELHNQAWWPAPLLLPPLAAALLLRARAGRAAAGLLAVAAAAVAVGFLWQRFAPINWAAQGFAVGFGVLAAALAMLGSRPALTTASAHRRRVGQGLLLWALLLHPFVAPLAGRPWLQAEVLALAPDPTAIAILGWLLCSAATGLWARAWRTLSGLLAGTWCVVSLATLWTMGSAQAIVPAAAVLLALGTWALTRGAPAPRR